MILSIFIEQSRIKMNLIKKGGILDPAPFKSRALHKNQDLTVLKRCGVDSEAFSYYHDINGKLITTLDKLLKRNNIDTTAFNSCKIQGNIGKNSTSYKIAAAFIEGLKVGV